MRAPRPDRDSDAASSAPDRLVVYGSLMRELPAAGGASGSPTPVPALEPDSEPEPDLLDRLGVGARLRRIGPCRVAGELFDLGPYPALRSAASAAASVVGELHAILDPDVLAVLDAFEGYDPRDPAGSDYLRECVELQEPPGVRAWIYVYNRSLAASPRVASGDWRRHLAERSLNPHVPGAPPHPTRAYEARATSRDAAPDEEEEEGWDS